MKLFATSRALCLSTVLSANVSWDDNHSLPLILYLWFVECNTIKLKNASLKKRAATTARSLQNFIRACALELRCIIFCWCMMDTFTVNLFYRQANRKTCKHVNMSTCHFGLVFIINLRGTSGLSWKEKRWRHWSYFYETRINYKKWTHAITKINISFLKMQLFACNLFLFLLTEFSRSAWGKVRFW